MKAVLTVFRKELKDTLRDRRTIITMVIIPLLLFPLLISISSRFMISRAKKAQEKVLVVGLVMKENAPDFREMLLEREDVRIVEGLSTEEGQTLVKADSLDAFLSFERKFDSHVADLRPGRITFYFKGTEDREIEKRRVGDLIEVYEGRLRESRFKNLDLDIAIIETVDVTEMNLATSKEKVADVIGGFLPYLFILFCFMGSMYTAIDLAAGEKERGTLETLLTSPVSRFHILLGKFDQFFRSFRMCFRQHFISGFIIGIISNRDFWCLRVQSKWIFSVGY